MAQAQAEALGSLGKHGGCPPRVASTRDVANSTWDLDPSEPRLHYLTAAGSAATRDARLRIDEIWRPAGIVPFQAPFLVPSELVEALPWREVVVFPRVAAGRARRAQGALPICGACLQALPFLRQTVQTYRQLPAGVYSVDFAFRPFASEADQLEDVCCVNGVSVRREGADRIMPSLIEAALEALAIDASAFREPWLFEHEATVWRVGGRVVAVADELPLKPLGKARVRYMEDHGRGTHAELETFYIAETALCRPEPPAR
jgi:hypothetical protein